MLLLEQINAHTPAEEAIKIVARAFNYFTVVGESVIFLDPLTQAELEPGMPPPSVLDSHYLEHGLQSLQEYGQNKRIRVHLILANHGSAHDFTDIISSRVLSSAPIVGIESSVPTYDDPPFTTRLIEATHPGRGAFQRAEHQWLNEKGKLILPCQLPTEAADPLSIALNDQWQRAEAVRNNAAQTYNEFARTAVYNAIAGSYQTTRQWTILARFGQLLQQPETQRILAKHDGPLDIPLILGSWHAPSANRLRNFCNIETSTTFIAPQTPHTAEYAIYGEINKQMTAHGRATMTELKMPIPY